VEAFHSTLEVVEEADLLLHVVDSSAPDVEDQVDAVRAVLAEIGAAAIPELMVFNKADLAPGRARELAEGHPGSVVVSASRGDGVDELLAAVAQRLRSSNRVVLLSIPYERGDVLAALHREGEVLESHEADGATVVKVTLPASAVSRFLPYIC
jgi:GTP-binding protein HflX